MDGESALMNLVLARGWYVVAPDYQGLHSAFTVGSQAAHATLDSIRAILTTEDITGIKADAQVAMWGYSGGTIPTGWAAQLQPKYAPELKNNLVGAAVGGWVTNVTATVEACDGTQMAGLIASGVNGLVNQYPWVKEELYSKIGSQEHRERFAKANELCMTGALVFFQNSYFFSGPEPWFYEGWDFFNDDFYVPLLRENTLAFEKGDGVPEIPLFVYHAKEDEVTPFVECERSYNNYCEWGIKSLEFAVSEQGNHLSEAFEGLPAVFKWIGDRLNGSAAVEGCRRTDRESNLEYPSADLSAYQQLRSTFEQIKQEALRPGQRRG